jgi:hypothetical protein
MDYVTHWAITIAIGFVLFLCGLTIQFFTKRNSRRR